MISRDRNLQLIAISLEFVLLLVKLSFLIGLKWFKRNFLVAFALQLLSYFSSYSFGLETVIISIWPFIDLKTL